MKTNFTYMANFMLSGKDLNLYSNVLENKVFPAIAVGLPVYGVGKALLTDKDWSGKNQQMDPSQITQEDRLKVAALRGVSGSLHGASLAIDPLYTKLSGGKRLSFPKMLAGHIGLDALGGVVGNQADKIVDDKYQEVYGKKPTRHSYLYGFIKGGIK